MGGDPQSRRLRLAVLADVHGNLPALEAVLADADAAGRPDAILVAGDHALGAPYPAEVLDRLLERGAALINGNRDLWLFRARRGDPPPGWYEGEHCGSGRWTSAQLGDDRLDCLEALPVSTTLDLPGATAVRMVHGSLAGPYGRVLPDDDPALLQRYRRNGGKPTPEDSATLALRAISEPVLVCGHTHLQWHQHLDGRLAVNPGSVGESLCGDPRARYALLHWDGEAWHVEPRAVAYDTGVLAPAFRERGLVETGGGFARATLRDMETGRNFTLWFYRHVALEARRAGLAEGDVFPDEVWQSAAATFDWEDGAP